MEMKAFSFLSLPYQNKIRKETPDGHIEIVKVNILPTTCTV